MQMCVYVYVWMWLRFFTPKTESELQPQVQVTCVSLEGIPEGATSQELRTWLVSN